MSSPHISVVVPTYNRADTVRAALASLLGQSFHDWEAIIVDDGSRDGDALQAAVAGFADPRLRYVRRDNGGGAAARNTGIDKARGRYIAFLDSDDVFLPAKLEIAAAALAPHADTDVVFFSRMLVERGVGKQWLKPTAGPREGERIDEYVMCTSGWIQTSTIVLPTALARRVRFTDGLPSSQDTDFAVRLASAGARFLFHPEPLVVMADAPDPIRVSKQRRYEPLLTWIEGMRGRHISDRAYWAYRGWQCARIAAMSNRLKGLSLFLPSAVRGVYPPKMAAVIAAQILVPQSLYQGIATRAVALLGRR